MQILHYENTDKYQFACIKRFMCKKTDYSNARLHKKALRFRKYLNTFIINGLVIETNTI